MDMENMSLFVSIPIILLGMVGFVWNLADIAARWMRDERLARFDQARVFADAGTALAEARVGDYVRPPYNDLRFARRGEVAEYGGGPRVLVVRTVRAPTGEWLNKVVRITADY